jgi:outer membrane lipopolysaccharide assembly protein LptE/RlpB
MARARILLSAVALVALAGCGYRLVGTASNIPPEIKKVYLAPLTNATGRVQVDQILTRAIADELVTRQRFDVVSSAEQADGEIDGTVTSFVARPVAFDAEGRATQYEISITVKVAFKQLSPEKVIWQNDKYQFRDSYQLETSELGYFDRETPAIEATAKKFAETMVTDLLEGF